MNKYNTKANTCKWLNCTAEEHYEKLFWMMCVWLLIQCLHCSASLELHLDNSAP